MTLKSTNPDQSPNQLFNRITEKPRSLIDTVFSRIHPVQTACQPVQFLMTIWKLLYQTEIPIIAMKVDLHVSTKLTLQITAERPRVKMNLIDFCHQKPAKLSNECVERIDMLNNLPPTPANVNLQALGVVFKITETTDKHCTRTLTEIFGQNKNFAMNLNAHQHGDERLLLQRRIHTTMTTEDASLITDDEP